ncbi:MAG: ABC transporter permease [Acidobacteriota bacterium]
MRRLLQAIADTIIGSFGSAVAHPLRTGLSSLAIAVAVATVAVVNTGLEGFSRFAGETSARAFGSDSFEVVQVVAGDLNQKELANKLERNPPILRSDVRFLERFARGQVIYSPIAQRRADVVSGSRKAEAVSVNGVGADMFRIRELGIIRGRFFEASEDRAGAQVVVLGAEIIDELFPAGDPLGQIVRLGGRGFRVIGLQRRQGTTVGVSMDRYAWIPIRAYERIYGAPASLQVFARAADGRSTQGAEDRARVTMRARRQLRPGSDANFDLLTPEASRGFVFEISQRISAAGGPISLAALLAAVVVITNTMLVSITEKTREIGIRRAAGASRRRIMGEVLAESMQVALLGGVAGILTSKALLLLGGKLLAFALPLSAATLGWSLAAAGLSGLVAGLYPARRAARIQVIQALRND